MISVPKKVEYGLILLAYLSKNSEENISLRQAARELFLPYRFLAKIAVGLKNGEFLTSKEGKSGGYFLELGWKKKSLYDLFVALEENKRMVECLEGDCKRAKGCRMQNIWRQLEKGMVTELKKIKLAKI